ncbi:MAG: alpha/beta hydrolase [Pseudomonadota bacterium]
MMRILFFLILVYLGVAGMVYFSQRILQYAPNRNYPGKPSDNHVAEMKELRVRTEDGLDLLAWFAPPRKKDGKVIVLYHGNAGHIGDRAGKMRLFTRAGYGVYLCEYRGYGGNRGSISEEGLYKDARSALKWLDANGYPAAQWILYGESIGSGPAVQMAKEFQPELLVLESPFSSALDVARGVYFWLPVDLLMKDKFDNMSRIKDVRSSLLIVHGEEDYVIPQSFARKLYDAANHPKQLVVIDGGHHNDLYEHHAGHIILEWLEKQP